MDSWYASTRSQTYGYDHKVKSESGESDETPSMFHVDKDYMHSGEEEKYQHDHTETKKQKDAGHVPDAKMPTSTTPSPSPAVNFSPSPPVFDLNAVPGYPNVYLMMNHLEPTGDAFFD